MAAAKDNFITVFIPTYNGEDRLNECLNAILDQKLPMDHQLELLVTDSGSSDGTLKILETYRDKLLLHKIPNSEFSHGGTRQKAAEMARGKFILFLTQDATPVNTEWLMNMIEPFFLDKRVGCVFGRQIPRPNEAVTIKREVATVFGQFGPEDAIMVHRANSLSSDQPTAPVNLFFSDVNSAVRRDLLVGQVPFRKVQYAEDQALARDMLSKGYLKAYAPKGAVWHSNHYSVNEYFRRKFDEFVGLQESAEHKAEPSIKKLLFGWIKPTIADYKFIFKDRAYGRKGKIKWLALSPFYNLGNYAGMYLAAKHFKNPEARRKYSLEANSKR